MHPPKTSEKGWFGFVLVLAMFLADFLPGRVQAQSQPSVISLRPGLLHYTEGKVLLSGAIGQQGRRGKFVHLLAGQRLNTKVGYAELILLPGIFLRQDKNSEIEMLTVKSSGVEFRLISGSIFIDISNNVSKDLLTLQCGISVVRFEKRGLYRCDIRSGKPPSLRVYRGKVSVLVLGQKFYLTSQQSIPVTENSHPPVITKFNSSKKDVFSKWNQSRERSLHPPPPPKPYS